jgi:hypothetical protein
MTELECENMKNKKIEKGKRVKQKITLFFMIFFVKESVHTFLKSVFLLQEESVLQSSQIQSI